MLASAFSRTLEAKENTLDSLSFEPGNVLAEKVTETSALFQHQLMEQILQAHRWLA
jgi:hypothetical protein